MKRKKIVYIGNAAFPEGDAASQLIESNIKILQKIGYEVFVIGKHAKKEKNKPFFETHYKYKQIDCYRLAFSNNPKFYFKELEQLENVISLLRSMKDDLSALVFYGSPATPFFYFEKLAKWCNQFNITLIVNCADISSFSHGKLHERLIKRINFLILKNNIQKRADGIIGVTKYIAEYFAKNNQPTIVLPPLVDKNIKYNLIYNKKDEKINILYAGIPFPIDGRKVSPNAYKDRLDITIELLAEAKKQNENFVLNIYGLTKEEYLSVIKEHKKLLNANEEIIKFHGRKNHQDIKKEISKADFTINLRDDNEMTKAGFSTKFVESISNGTPTIVTRTSEVDNFLIEGKNGYIIDINNKERAIKEILEILNSSEEKRDYMKNYCEQSRIFDYREYVDMVEQYLIKVKKE